MVVSGLRNGPPNYAVHGAASTRFLTTAPPLASTGSVVEAGISADQLVASRYARETQLASLELSLESPRVEGIGSVSGDHSQKCELYEHRPRDELGVSRNEVCGLTHMPAEGECVRQHPLPLHGVSIRDLLGDDAVVG